MKGLQEAINNHIMNSRNQKRYLAILVAMSMFISLMVPLLLIEPAISLTADYKSEDDILLSAADNSLTNYANEAGNEVDGVTYSPLTMSDVDLLVGKGSALAQGATSAADAIENAKAAYFLGIASEFCVFLEDDFIPTAADAEGRVAVGGNIRYVGKWDNYQVGAGDFSDSIALKDTDNYVGVSDFAHLIMGGKILETISLYGTTDKGEKLADLDKDRYKRFVVYENNFSYDDSSHKSGNNGSLIKYSNDDHKHNIPWTDEKDASDELSQIYVSKANAPLIDFAEAFSYIRGQSTRLKEIEQTKDATVSWSGTVLNCTVPEGYEAKTVYFKLDEWKNNPTEINFNNIPKYTDDNGNEKLANIVVTCGQSRIDITEQVNTKINGSSITVGQKDSNGKDNKNNHKYCENILYNFYDAGNVVINANFNGTILAPNADVTSYDPDRFSTPEEMEEAARKEQIGCNGHLSGALIAKSFKGGMEFGYRPYRGSVDILGAKSGYVIPVDKFLEGTNIFLPGASLVIKDDSGKTVESWTSGDSTKFATIPTLIDFSGKTNYKDENNTGVYDAVYHISESSAPSGFIKTDKSYTVSVHEEIDKEFLIDNPDLGGTIPQVVNVEIKISDDTNPDNIDVLTFQYRDSYETGENGLGLVQRKMIIGDKVFAMDIVTNGGSQTVAKLGFIDNYNENDDVETQTTTTTTTTTTTEETTTTTTTTVTELEEVQNPEEPQNQDEAEPIVQDPVEPAAASLDEEILLLEAEEEPSETSEEPTEPTEETAGKRIIKLDISQEISPPEGSSLRDSWEFGVDSKNYHYDSHNMIVMPIDMSNRPQFENAPGLVFQKVDSSGKNLTGANITLTPEVTGWEWDSTRSSSALIDLKNLIDGAEYTFHEETPPAGYETASDIHFTKDGNVITYWSADTPDVKTTTTIVNEPGVIQMIDIKIDGAIIKLGKFNADLTKRLEGAKFQLCSTRNNDEAVYPLTGSFEIPKDKDFDLFETLRDAADDTYNINYVKNGYLVPGTYILKEIDPPTGYQPQDFNFRVKAGANGTYEIEPIASGTPAYISVELEKMSNDGGDKQVFVYPKDAKDNRISVSNVTKIEVELIKPSSGELIVYESGSFDGKTANITDGVAVFDNLNNISFDKFKLQNNSYGDGLEVKEVRIYGEAGSSSGSGGSTPTPYNIKNIMFNANGSLPNIEQVTFYYSDKDPQSISNVSISDSGEWDHYFDLSGLNMQNVIGIKIKTGNTGDDWKKIIIRDTNDSLILGTTWDDNNAIKLSKNEEKLLGFDKMPEPTSPQPDDPPAGDTEGELLDLSVGEDGVIKIPNQKPGVNISIEVEKVWAGDEGFESLRPENISVTLKRKLPNGTEDASFNDASYTAELSSTNNWKKTWSNLPRLANENGEDAEANWYKYYVVENIECANYKVAYSENNSTGLSTGGKITITNTLETTDFPVQKIWSVPEGSDVTIPDTLSVRLQWKNGDTWAYVPGVSTVTLTSSNEYKHTFTNLPKGKEYRVIETRVPNGWKYDEGASKLVNGVYQIVNKPDLSQLKVKKKWSNDASSSRPSQIKLKLYRAVKSSGGSGGNTGGDVIAAAPNFDPDLTTNLYPAGQTKEERIEDYARLLQYSLYFYDANMCGDQVDENSAYDWRKDCHTYSAVKGGFHDAGDHTMFGLPQGFTASTLGWSYYEFKDSYNKLGLTDHYKTIMKYFCDFFVDSTKLNDNGEVSNFLYQKGNGNTDHNYWGSPEIQSQDQFGQDYWTTNGASDIAANYAAALAQYSINFPDDPNSSTYLNYAEALYAFSTKNNSCTSDGPSGFYWDERTDATDEQAWAVTWLYLATKDENYRTNAQTKIKEAQNKLNSEPRGHFWNNTTLGAATVYSSHIDESDADIKKIVTDYLTKNCIGSDYKIVEWGDWGSARHNTLLQTVALSASKNLDGIDYSEWCKNQMKYILGDNNGDVCLVTGFSDKSVNHVHHRAASVNKDNNNYKHTLVGALAGGPGSTNFANYPNDVENYKENEVACDYNAGLVAAAAGLYDFFGTGETYSNVEPKTRSNARAAKTLEQLQRAEWIAEGVISDDEEITNNVNSVLSSVIDDMPLVRAGEKNVIELTSDQINTAVSQNNGLDIESICSGKTITKIVVAWSDCNGSVVLNGGTVYQGSSFTYCTYADGVLTISPMDEEHFHCPWGGSANPKDLKTIKFNKWGGDITSVKLYYSLGTSFTVTPEKTNLIVGETTNLTVSGATGTVTWDLTNAGGCTIDGTTLKTGNQTGTFTISGTDEDGKQGDFTITVNPFEVSPSTAAIAEGTNTTLTANKSVSEWTASNDKVTITKNDDNSCTVTAKANTSGDVTITAKDADGNTASSTITIRGASISVVPDSVTLHAGKNATITPTPSDGVTYSIENTSIATIDSNGTITGAAPGTTRAVVTRNGQSAYVDVNVLEPLSIVGNHFMNKGTSQKLTAANNIGSVTWEVIEGGDVITIDSDGNVCSDPTTEGSAKVRATDSDGTTAEFDITIKLTAITPELPADKEWIADITLTKDGNWEKILNLPKTDNSGREYEYYIVEVGDNGEPITEISGTGGVKYIPIEYENNGTVIGTGETVISVTNEANEKPENPGYELPNTGGEGVTRYYYTGAALILLSAFAGSNRIRRRLKERRTK